MVWFWQKKVKLENFRNEAEYCVGEPVLNGGKKWYPVVKEATRLYDEVMYTKGVETSRKTKLNITYGSPFFTETIEYASTHDEALSIAEGYQE